ncbi:hypothetical protein [Nocardia fluminea]|uniref:hypothetical protein n=1 Tax=Nocardia fluminea TaxID=134984 RepID=UPI0037B7EFD4
MSAVQVGLSLVIAVPVAVILAVMCWPSADKCAPNPGWFHRAPDYPLSVAEAHRAMQVHRTCSAVDCPRKQAARAVLVGAGRMVPDPRRSY